MISSRIQRSARRVPSFAADEGSLDEMKRMTRESLIAGSIAGFLCIPSAPAQGSGSICVAPGGFDEFSKGGATVDAYQAHLHEPKASSESVRFVRVDRLPPARVTSSKPARIAGIGTAGRHVVTISKQSDMTQPLAKFHFSFREQESKRLCLWYETFYGTWRLQPRKNDFCRCD